MLELFYMRKIAFVALRVIIVFLAAEAVSFVYGVATAYVAGQGTPVAAAGVSFAAMAIGVCAMVGVFSAFPPLNRFYKSRFAGYAILGVLASAVLIGSSLFGNALSLFGERSALAALPGGFGALAEWVAAASALPPMQAAVRLVAVSAYAVSFWGISRISDKRPLVGALLTPSACLAAIELFGLYLRGPARDVLGFLGLKLNPTDGTAALCAATALLLVMFDILISARPKAGGRHA